MYPNPITPKLEQMASLGFEDNRLSDIAIILKDAEFSAQLT
jgi:hypothetical protein